MKKKVILFLVAILTIFVGASISSKPVSAAKYGKVYTTPRKMRGTWYYKSGKVNSDAPKKYMRQYKKIRITAHTITFTRRHKLGLSGKYTLRKFPGNYSMKKMFAAEKYIRKHKQLSVYNPKKNGFSFSTWLRVFQESAAGDLSVSGKKLTFGNAYCVSTFRK